MFTSVDGKKEKEVKSEGKKSDWKSVTYSPVIGISAVLCQNKRQRRVKV